MPPKKEPPRGLNGFVDHLKKRDSEVRLEDFRDVTFKIPGNINAEVPEGKNGFLFDLNTGRVYALNTTGSLIFRKIRAGISLSEVVKDLIREFDVDEGTAVSDVQDFLYQLREFGVGSE